MRLQILRTVPYSSPLLLLGLLASWAVAPAPAAAQVRIKSQDRGSYQPPDLADHQRSASPAPALSETAAASETATAAGGWEPIAVAGQAAHGPAADGLVAPVGYESIEQPILLEGESYVGGGYPGGGHPGGGGCSCGSVVCDSVGCDSLGCDSLGCDVSGCDGLGCGHVGPVHRLFGGPTSPWFGSAELLLWWRRPQALPPLVTTSPDGTDRDLAGQLDQADTSILFGNDYYGDTLSAGGRFTLGRWLDPVGHHSFNMRFWLTGEENYGFDTNSVVTPIIARPFLNVTDPNNIEADAALIAFPGEFDGNVSVSGTSDIYGADVSLRQLHREGLGGRIDFLYGYQYLRINESLDIRGESIVVGGTALPIGSMFAIRDQFDVQNEFHGGQVGFNGFHREGCWTLDGLIKFGFGNLSRRGALIGETFRASGGQTATSPDGLLVRSSNRGTFSDSTFAWVPELNVNVGYSWRPGVDLTVGYSVIGLTEALQPWRTIDPNLPVDTNDQATRPLASFSYSTHWVQGINFGLRWNY